MSSEQQTAMFIGGVGRSGTTLVVDMLGLHPSVSPIYETDFVLYFLEFVRNHRLPQLHAAMEFSLDWATPLPYRPHSKRKHEKYHHGPHYILFTLRHMRERLDAFGDNLSASDLVLEINRMIHALFLYHCELDQKILWINKTPDYVLYLPELRQVFPNMKFVHCIRDGRDVACSAVTRPWGPKNHLDAVHLWTSEILAAREFGKAYPRAYLEVKYEDLLTHTEPTLKRLFAFLQLEDESSALLDVYNEGGNGIRLMESYIGNWRTQFDDEEKAMYWNVAGELLSDLGYSR